MHHSIIFDICATQHVQICVLRQTMHIIFNLHLQFDFTKQIHNNIHLIDEIKACSNLVSYTFNANVHGKLDVRGFVD